MSEPGADTSRHPLWCEGDDTARSPAGHQLHADDAAERASYDCDQGGFSACAVVAWRLHCMESGSAKGLAR